MKTWTKTARSVLFTFTVLAILGLPWLPRSASAQLINLSTRGLVGTGDNVMIGGFIIDWIPTTVLIRGRGPSLAGAPFFVPGTLADPFLRLFSWHTPVAENDNWQDPPSCSFPCGDATDIVATGLDPCQPNPGQLVSPPACTLESAILITLPPGAYTVTLGGVAGGTGVGLLEVFDVSPDFLFGPSR